MRRLVWILGITLLVAAAGVALALTSTDGEPPAPKLEVYGNLPPFQFTDQDGHRFTDDDLRGHVTIANVVYTRCPSVCPVTTMKMRRIEKQTKALGDQVQLVSFSIDPDYDTPERLAAFAREHHADTSRWSFLTGPKDEIDARVQGSLKIAIDRSFTTPNGDPDYKHGTHFILLDQKLQIRGFYNPADQERLDALVDHAKFLAQQKP